MINLRLTGSKVSLSLVNTSLFLIYCHI
ncbi:hypothetical protein CY0110_18767 [Crocosphaera chwakensis CCY0110]|uniref:Uncharacterized protein n=1 Tax=Crocosphaera chwakensis CCY0110 TaxID=391612 RepID=A3IJ85_9CHRO|nr:hypothetical protein CY0110_18767 [Crocosphaera chwakensis CCY0110]